MAYLTRTELPAYCVISQSDLDVLETKQPGYIQARLDQFSALLDARLRKRYAAPFATPYPEAVKVWLGQLVTIPLYLRIGITPGDEQFQTVLAERDQAVKDVNEAANGNTGLWDLPLRQDTNMSGLSQDTPTSFHNPSPYALLDEQREW